MPVIEVNWYAGRDKATKARTMELLTKVMCEAVGCKPEVVEIVFHDIEKYNWGTAGKPHGN